MNNRAKRDRHEYNQKLINRGTLTFWADDQIADSCQLPKLLEKSPKSVKKVLADGAYDRANCRQDLLKRGIECFTPPIRKGRQRSGQE